MRYIWNLKKRKSKMAKTAMIRARTERHLKKEVKQIFTRLGLSESEAINLFYRQVRLRNGIPFEIRIPNKLTQKVFEDTDKGINLKRFQKGL